LSQQEKKLGIEKSKKKPCGEQKKDPSFPLGFHKQKTEEIKLSEKKSQLFLPSSEGREKSPLVHQRSSQSLRYHTNKSSHHTYTARCHHDHHRQPLSQAKTKETKGSQAFRNFVCCVYIGRFRKLMPPFGLHHPKPLF